MPDSTTTILYMAQNETDAKLEALKKIFANLTSKIQDFSGVQMSQMIQLNRTEEGLRSLNQTVSGLEARIALLEGIKGNTTEEN